jgi:hypothetical protein
MIDEYYVFVMYIGFTLNCPFICHCECGLVFEYLNTMSMLGRKADFKLQNVFTSCVICQSPNFLIMVVRACLCTYSYVYEKQWKCAMVYCIVMLCIWLHAYLSIFNSPHWNSWTWQNEPNPHPQLKGLIHETKSCMLQSTFFENLTKLCEKHVPVHLKIV